MPHPKDRKSQLRFQTQNSMMNLLKKGISKRNFYMFNSPWKFFGWPSAEKFEAEKLVVLTGDLSIISIGKVLKADLKKSFFCYKYWWASISTILVITKIYIYIYIYFFLFYFIIVIDDVKPTYLDSVNSNIYSCILSLLKLYGIVSLMKWIYCIYANLFNFWFDKRQRYVMLNFANSTVGYENG